MNSIRENPVRPKHVKYLCFLHITVCISGFAQLVVVGDQSSGKSSVLEGLTKLAFPRDSGLCTRFATQIIFRRTEAGERTITATIIPGSDAINPSQLREWKASNLESLDAAAFSMMMSEVSALDDGGRAKLNLILIGSFTHGPFHIKGGRITNIFEQRIATGDLQPGGRSFECD